ncbi:uncharacterized protein PHACADRAFT_262454 [Phanerochaete carnosa HHB-10118-sp]|uniref:F-box domain-containing protein n=1 Tax=Phanerochaete carnosa (strain HHB-10118-sp) TaxID=650164 RepID=K5VYV2_PHACS|nr:uncharacterized protein PHACADRAFT_262454 [Phanerochaete carnosa HHB-10118-sp]EKM52005.1 hypothetical protein PHACADRAFT_262454 [Phanerochaete carnosa HHB-10118-sp]
MARGKGVKNLSTTAVKNQPIFARKEKKSKKKFVFRKTLSPEIVDAVIYYLRDDKESLRQCSVVSKIWSIATAQYLCKSFRWPPCKQYWGEFNPNECSCLADEEGLATFLNFLDRSERVRQAIQSLRFSFCQAKDEEIPNNCGGVTRIWSQTPRTSTPDASSTSSNGYPSYTLCPSTDPACRRTLLSQIAHTVFRPLNTLRLRN